MEKRVAAVKMRNITKTFGPVVANDHAKLTIYKGEILSLLGENGSGKTTLMNMLSGIYYPDEGNIFINGEKVVIRSPKDAFDHGIGMIHQHFKLVDVLTATDNIILGLEGKLDLKAASKKIRQICDAYGFDIDPDQKIYNMSVSQKQTVEIVKVLYRGADILILDEPTAGLDPRGRDETLALLKSYRKDHNKTILIASHSMEDVASFADRVMVFNKSRLVMFDTVSNVFSQVEQLNQIGLDIPQVTQLFIKLREKGYSVPRNIFTVDDAISALISLKKGGMGIA